MPRASVITLSDKGAEGLREDESGPAVAAMLGEAGFEVGQVDILPDEIEDIKAALIDKCGRVDLIVTTGGTGLSPRDVTPEATLAVIERRIPGIPEAMRAEGMKITPRAMLSRAEAGMREGTIIINLPGSLKAARESLKAVLPTLAHAIEKARGDLSDCARE